jgi:four helix bundle protein
MATIERFEEIEAWQKARELIKEIYRLSNAGGFAKDFGLRHQIRRAAVSIMSNIAEGFERDGAGDFANFLSIAKGSVGEVRSQLYICLDQSHMDDSDFQKLIALTLDIGRMLNGLIQYLKHAGIPGRKYK